MQVGLSSSSTAGARPYPDGCGYKVEQLKSLRLQIMAYQYIQKRSPLPAVLVSLLGRALCNCLLRPVLELGAVCALELDIKGSCSCIHCLLACLLILSQRSADLSALPYFSTLCRTANIRCSLT